MQVSTLLAKFSKLVTKSGRGFWTSTCEGPSLVPEKPLYGWNLKGVIINIVSTAAFNSSNGANPAHYVASKHAVAGLTKSLAVELGPKGIRTVGVAPTLTETPGVNSKRAEGDAVTEALIQYAQGLPLGRLGLPDDIARVVLFAASDLGAFVTGTIIPVDGGDLAR